MNFFEQQDLAHRNTKRLVFLLCLAVISLIAITTLLFSAAFYYMALNTQTIMSNTGLWQGISQTMSWKMFAGISAVVCAVIMAGSLYKLIQLSSGGRVVAEALGGRPLNVVNANADEKKILNVVEEMAIASGTPVPPVYLIEDEAINAFAAGHTPQDAVIGVTRGCIRLLTRDELQGVIAHEFSHIFHGDMRLNLRLVALLNGILLLGLIGEFLLRSAGHRRTFGGSNFGSNNFSTSKNKSPAAIMGLGLGLVVIGYTGTFFGKLIKAAVSRQREFLADASAVKFTRNPDGIGGALKKLGGYVGGSQMDVAHASEFSHLFFGEGTGASSLFNALATHPPLEERIKRIDPHWDGQFKQIDIYQESENSHVAANASLESTYIEEGRLSEGTQAAGKLDDAQVFALSDAPAPSDAQQEFGVQQEFSAQQTLNPQREFDAPQNATEFAVCVDQAFQAIGHPNQNHLAYAQQTLNSISSQLHDAAHNPWEAQALMLGLLLNKETETQAVQWQLLQQVFSAAQMHSLKPWALQASLLAPRLRLALLDISLPALKHLSAPQYQLFKAAMKGVIRANDHTDLIEWSFFRIITHNLEPQKIPNRFVDLTHLKNEACTLLSIVAYAGATSVENAQAAFNSGKTILGFDDATLMNESDYSLIDLDLAITRLNCLKPLQKPKLLKAMSQCVLADQNITVLEAELFRAIADTLDCPVPPLIVANQ
jgi:Zn-dependent protease with chaperone function